MTTWSRTSIFNSWPARIRSRVTFISLSDGVGSPDGWLCAPLRPSVPLPLADAQTEARRRKVHVKHLRRVAAPIFIAPVCVGHSPTDQNSDVETPALACELVLLCSIRKRLNVAVGRST